MNDRRNHHERSMSEPRHIYFSTVTAVFQPYIHPKERDNDVRFTQTSGPEWDALMERAREALNAYPHSAVGKEGVLRDLLAYFGEQP